ncbi:hypothetical protein Tco_1378661 [Tanacetum coccineum]
MSQGHNTIASVCLDVCGSGYTSRRTAPKWQEQVPDGVNEDNPGQEEKTDTSNALDALDASSVIIERNEIESKEQDTSSRSGNDAHVDDADIRPIYDEESMAENAEQCHDIRPLRAKLTDNMTTELSNQSLESGNSVAKLLAENEQLHKEKEHLKQTYKDLFDSIKRTSVSSTKDQNDLECTTNKKSNDCRCTSSDLEKKGFAIADIKQNGKDFASSTKQRLKCEPQMGSKVDIPFIFMHANKLWVSAEIKPRFFMGNDVCSHQFMPRSSSNIYLTHNRSELRIQDHSNEQSSSKLVPKVVP